MHSTTSQTDRILDLLRSRGSAGLTTLEALEEAQCFRLASRVNDLRKSGHAITTHMVELPSGKRIARYEIQEPATDDGTPLGDVLANGINSVMDTLTNGLGASHGTEVDDGTGQVQELATRPEAITV